VYRKFLSERVNGYEAIVAVPGENRYLLDKVPDFYERLKASYDVSLMTGQSRIVAQALKTYGMMVADNGGDWDLSIPPDARLKGLEALRKLKGGDFEVVVSTGENDAGR
jgi:hypothetical protein